MFDSRRRAFITLLAGAAVWPLAARAEQSDVPLVGFLHQGSAGSNGKMVDAFLRGLQDAGYEDRRNIQLKFHWADGRYDRLGSLVADLVRLRPAVIAAALLPAAQAAKSATTTIPVIFITGSDPIETGLVASLARPTSNVTGVSLFSVPLISKRLELLHELVPGRTAVAVLVNPSNPNARSNELEIENAARVIGLKLAFMGAAGERELEAAFASIAQQRFGAAVVSADGLFASRREQLVALAARHSIPTMYFQREFVDAGGLISYGANSPTMYQQAGNYVGRILKGAPPSDLPVMQPTKLELVINLKTANALGLMVPPTLLALADEVIE
jgi:putative tryptophan/tyrosine transport system substrate-binding protein